MKWDLYEGVVLKRDDPKKIGRYYVYIPELQYNDKTDSPPVKNKFSGIWCYNLLSNFARYTETELLKCDKNNCSYGSYQPLKPGTHVLVGFREEANEYWNYGYILNVITFEIPPNKERDDFYLLQKTDKESWAYIDEKTSDFAMTFRKGKSNVWGNEKHVQISKDSGTVIDVQDNSITAFHKSGNYCYIDDKKITSQIDGNFVRLTKDAIDLEIGGSYVHMTKNKIAINSQTVQINGGAKVIIQGGQVQINDGVAAGAAPGAAVKKSKVAKPSLDAIKEINTTDEKLFKKLNNGE